ncbi:hypothetical protein ACFLQX_02095 [Bacteroidota bacterium]
MIRRRIYKLLILCMLVTLSANALFAQESEYDSLLQRIDTIENPVYKPVVSIGYGVLNFLGDVKNSYQLPVIGNPAVRINVSTFIDNKQFITANFFFMTGILNGNQTSATDPTQNLNFSTNIYSIGANARYGFGHLIPKEMKLRPYISLGVEQLNFSTKGDLFDSDDVLYNYWPDGTIRTIGAGEIGAAYPMHRDYVYETDLRSYEGGSYSQRSIGLPFEIGLMLNISQRVLMSLGTEFHYTFTDYIDNVASEGTFHVGNPGNDMYMFTNVTLHFDMFSDPSTRTVELLFADVELDPFFFDDEDGDFIPDVADHCPETPYGVVTDTLGCPLDGDADGVPDYLDKEPGSATGIWVDDEGVTINEDDFLLSLQREEALMREDLEAYMALFEETFMEMQVTEIPEKYAVLDSDEDGYISFDELLNVVDDFFDLKVNLSLGELRELNEYFFSQ